MHASVVPFADRGILEQVDGLLIQVGEVRVIQSVLGLQTNRQRQGSGMKQQEGAVLNGK